MIVQSICAIVIHPPHYGDEEDEQPWDGEYAEKHGYVVTDVSFNYEMDFQAECFVAVTNLQDSFVPDPGQDHTGTLNKKQKKMLINGIEDVQQKDDAMWSTLRGIPGITKTFFVIAMVTSHFAQAVGQVAHIVSPGENAEDCNPQLLDQIEDQVEQNDPFVIYINLGFERDEDSNKNSSRIM